MRQEPTTSSKTAYASQQVARSVPAPQAVASRRVGSGVVHWLREGWLPSGWLGRAACGAGTLRATFATPLKLGVILLLGVCSQFAHALDSLSWSDPDFQARFLGSYGFDGPREPSVTSAEQQALKSIVPLMEQGQLTEAARRLRDQTTPDSSAAFDYTLGNLYLQSGNLGAAESAYREALRKMPGFVRAWRNLGLMLAQSGRSGEAVSALGEAISRGDNSAECYGALAYCHFQNGDYATALPGYEQASFLAPHSADWQLGRAQCLIQLERAKEALGVAERYLKEHPKHAEARRVAVNACIAMQDWENAAVHLELLRLHELANAQALLQLGRAYLALGLPHRATQAFMDALRLQEKPSLLQLLSSAELLAQQGAVQETESLLTVVYQQYGDGLSGEGMNQLLRLQGRLKLMNEEPAAAARLLAEAASRDPLSGRTLLLLGVAQIELEHYAEAQVTLERAVKLDEVAADAYLELARVHVKQAHWPQAAEALRSAQRIRPEDRVAQYLENIQRLAEQGS
ncbi:tetratricopeptide repeat protein [Cerasicoccus maritimus]|uniref:tetratricopeptide repeat protein n=1 Tax=Cerasicoccus maritimus TaxID=490089 RepID=UPI00285277B0|nr:tetratricopeptide repeat protein [Cerasicoccus maritimus]